MKNINYKTLLFCIAAMSLLCPQITYARDKLPLKRGIYVRSGVACNSASNAYILNYNGKNSGLGDAHQPATIIRLSKHGKTYIISERLKGLGGVGGEGTSTLQQTVTIRSNTSFLLKNEYTGNKGVLYRWCSK